MDEGAGFGRHAGRSRGRILGRSRGVPREQPEGRGNESKRAKEGRLQKRAPGVKGPQGHYLSGAQ
jgi:hypothetical protein